MIISEYIQKIIPYPPGKPLEELEREYGITGSIKLASNENPWGPSPAAVEAIKQAASNLHRYPDGSSYYLTRALADHLMVDPAAIVFGNGSNEVIEFLTKVFVARNDHVVTSHPTFLMYEKTVQVRGGEITAVPLKKMCHDLHAIHKAVTEKTRLIFLDIPNNPCGSIVAPKVFEGFLKDLPQGILVVVDEAYIDFVAPAKRLPMANYLKNEPRVVVLRTFSKAYGLAGLRIGYGLMDPEVASYLHRVRQPFNINSMAQVGALAALSDEDHFQRTIRDTASGMKYLQQKLQEMGLPVYPSHTNFFLFDVKKEAKAIYEGLLRKGVIIRPMTAYGFPTLLRVTVGTEEENKRFLGALQDVLTTGE